MINKEMLLQSAKRKGLINKEHIEKDYFQDILLFNIYKETNLLIFKGGTALYKLYNMPRFSEDLDFSVLKDFDIERTVKKIVKNIHGAEIKEMKKMEGSLIIKVAFKGIITKYNTIRIDINIKNSILKKFNIKTYISNYIDINPFNLRILALEEIIAEKIHAIFARQKARDLYDLFFLLKFTEVDKKLINEKLSYFNMKFSYGRLRKEINELETLWEKELKSFVLSNLPDFFVIKNFVLNKFKGL